MNEIHSFKRIWDPTSWGRGMIIRAPKGWVTRALEKVK